jgi:ribonuclease P protein component
MPKASYRLAKKKDIDNVFKNGRSSYSPLLGVKAGVSNNEHYRLAFIISSKVSKKAVDRNLIRRRLNEIIRKEMKNRLGSFDIVIIVLPAAKGKTTQELKFSLGSAFKHLSLLK